MPSKSRHVPDLFDTQGRGEYTTWQENSVTHVRTTPKVTTLGVPMTPPPLASLRGQQTTVDERHAGWGSFIRSNRNNRTFPGDLGGNFFSQKTTVTAEFPQFQHVTGRQDLGTGQDRVSEWYGPVYATVVAANIMSQPIPPQGNLDVLGTTAIARCKPTNQVAQAANFLRELHTEGLPKLFGATLWQGKTSIARSAGDEYLNAQFGWLPLVSDVHDLYHAVTHSHSVLEQFERGSGRVTRRRYSFPVTKTTTSSVVAGSRNPVVFDGQPEFLDRTKPNATLYRDTTTETQVWFSGAFTYHLPWGYDSRVGMIRNARQAMTLTGLDLTPEVVWNATPWTWAIDWFSNAGDVVSNLSDWATDGLALKYGYVMEHSIKTDRYSLDGPGRLFSPKVYPSPIVLRTEIKRRRVATPFGFGLSWTGLTIRQLAIAAALGITRR